MNEGHRAVLFFDLLGMSETIQSNLEEASEQLLQLSLLLPRATSGKDWEVGFHLSDSTFLVHKDISKAICNSIHLYQWLFDYHVTDLNLPDFHFGMDDPSAYSREGLSCLPRGAIAVGEVRLIPKIEWKPRTGFIRTEREVSNKS